jgi:hypothetical protein
VSYIPSQWCSLTLYSRMGDYHRCLAESATGDKWKDSADKSSISPPSPSNLTCNLVSVPTPGLPMCGHTITPQIATLPYKHYGPPTFDPTSYLDLGHCPGKLSTLH